MIFEDVVCVLGGRHPGWWRLSIRELVGLLRPELDDAQIVELHLEAVFRKREAPKGIPRARANRLAQVSYVLMSPRFCRELARDPELAAAYVLARSGIARVPEDLWRGKSSPGLGPCGSAATPSDA